MHALNVENGLAIQFVRHYVFIWNGNWLQTPVIAAWLHWSVFFGTRYNGYIYTNSLSKQHSLEVFLSRCDKCCERSLSWCQTCSFSRSWCSVSPSIVVMIVLASSECLVLATNFVSPSINFLRHKSTIWSKCCKKLAPISGCLTLATTTFQANDLRWLMSSVITFWPYDVLIVVFIDFASATLIGLYDWRTALTLLICRSLLDCCNVWRLLQLHH